MQPRVPREEPLPCLIKRKEPVSGGEEDENCNIVCQVQLFGKADIGQPDWNVLPSKAVRKTLLRIGVVQKGNAGIGEPVQRTSKRSGGEHADPHIGRVERGSDNANNRRSLNFLLRKNAGHIKRPGRRHSCVHSAFSRG